MGKKNGMDMILLGGLALIGMSSKTATAQTIVQEIVKPVTNTTNSGLPIPINAPINPYTSAPLPSIQEKYEPFNTSMVDLNANIAWAAQQGYKLISIETVTAKDLTNQWRNDGYIAHMVK